MICPKCGFEQPDAHECASCGIIIAKFKARQEAAASAPPTEPEPQAPPIEPEPQAPPTELEPQAPPTELEPQAPPTEPEPQAPPPELEPQAPPPPQDTSPGWARETDSAQQAQGQIGSRYTTYDRHEFSQAQTQEALRKILVTAGVLAVAIIILAAGISFMGVYNSFAKLEIDVNNFMADLSNTTPPAIKTNIMSAVKKRGFEVKGGDFQMIITGPGGQDIGQLTEMMPDNMVWNLEGKVEFDVVREAGGFVPITITLISTTPFVSRDSSTEVRSWVGLDPIVVQDEPDEIYEADYYDSDWH